MSVTLKFVFAVQIYIIFLKRLTFLTKNKQNTNKL